MDSSEYLVPSESTSSIVNQKTHWDQKVSVLKEVKVECTDEETPWNDFMYEPKPPESTEYTSHYVNEFDLLDQLKTEFYEEECPESSCSLRDKIVLEDEVILKFINKQELKNNNADEEGYFLNVKVKDEIKKYPITIKTERFEEQDVFDKAGDASVHYDILVTPEEVQCKWCDRIFKNTFSLLMHNIDHMKLDVNIKRSNKKGPYVYKNIKLNINNIKRRKRKHKNDKLYHCKECNSRMDYRHWQRHVDTVHSAEEFVCDLCGKTFRCLKYLHKHIASIHTAGNSEKVVQCEHCDKSFKHKYNLYCHVRNCHSNENLRCESCNRVFKNKPYLSQHIKRIHQDYGRPFPCWCGKEFRTQRRLAYHIRSRHG